MYLIAQNIIFLFVLLTLSNCKKEQGEKGLWESNYTLNDIQSSEKFSLVNQNTINQNLKEISGLVGGIRNEQFVYMIQDQGNSNEVHVFDINGVFVTKFVLIGLENIDWEDIAIGPGPEPNESYIYVADIGDNEAKRSSVRIIRFPEPYISVNTSTSVSISNYDVINFKYPTGAKDAETLMINPFNKDLIIMTKRDLVTRVYKIEYPYNLSMNDAVFVGLLPLKKLVGGDISYDGQRAVVKNKSTIYYWDFDNNDILKSFFHNTPRIVDYIAEPQGESIGFSKDGKSYYTITETKGHPGAEPILYQYKEN